jgi:hypothetical protein
MKICATIAKPEAERVLVELERGMPYIHDMPGLGSFFRNGFLTLLRDVETSDLVFRLVGARDRLGRGVDGVRPPRYWLLDRETQAVRELATAEVVEIDRARTLH